MRRLVNNSSRLFFPQSTRYVGAAIKVVIQNYITFDLMDLVVTDTTD